MAIITGVFDGETPISLITVIGTMKEGGDLDLLFDKKCEELVQDIRVTRVLVNLRDCMVIGQAGIGPMAWLLTKVSERGGRVHFIMAPDSKLKDKLRLCCLLQLFPVYATELEATQAFEQEPAPPVSQT